MSALDQLQRASFLTVEFPIKRCTVRGGLRDHVHEFPKAAGGAPEKLGRKLYEIAMDAIFVDTFRSYGADLWPGNLADLRDQFEQEVTGDLLVPQLGKIKAYCINWTQTLDAKMRSGETCEFVFREDQSAAFLVTNLINIQAQDLGTTSTALFTEASASGFGDIFSSLQNAIGAVQGLVDTVELYGALAQAKIDGIVDAFARLDQTFTPLNDPNQAPLLEAFLAAWAAAAQLQANVLQQSDPIVPYVVPIDMSVSAISTALYGDASRAVDLLSINPIEDAFLVRRGTKLKVFGGDALAA